MATVKLIEDKELLYAKGGKSTHTMNMVNLTVDTITKGTINFADSPDIYKISFIEKLVWGDDDKETYKDFTASFQDYENNLANIQELSRGDSCNVIIKFPSNDDGYFQNIKLIKKTDGKDGYTTQEAKIPHTEESLPDFQETKETVEVNTPIEDVKLPPEAEFRFAIPYHDRRNLSIQRQ